MFNWATVIILLPLEIVSGWWRRRVIDRSSFHEDLFVGVLFHLTEAITRTISLDRKTSSNPQFLNVLTRPLTHRIIQVRESWSMRFLKKVVRPPFQLDERVIQNIAMGMDDPNASLLKRFCSYQNVTTEFGNSTLVPDKRCAFIFSKVSWPDWGVGLLLLALSLLALCGCLILLVKLLQSMLKGTISTVIFKTVNADFPGVFRHLTPYLAIGVTHLKRLPRHSPSSPLSSRSVASSPS